MSLQQDHALPSPIPSALARGQDRPTDGAFPPEQSAALPAGLSLRRNFSWTLAGNMIYAGCQWGWLVVLAKLGTPELVGRFALGLAITTPVLMLTNLQLRSVQTTDARQEYQFSDYFGLRLLTTLLAFLFIIINTRISGQHPATMWVILAVGLAKSFESISDIFYGLLQQHERMDRIAKSMMIKGPLSLLALAVTVACTHSVLWGAMALAATWVIVLLAYDLPSGMIILRTQARALGVTNEGMIRRALLSPRWNAAVLRKLVWLSLPLGLVMMLVTLNGNLPRYLIAAHLGEHGLGIFAAIATLMAACGTVVYALGQSASPRLARYYADGDARAFTTLLLKLEALGLVLGALGVLAARVGGHGILTLLFKPEYALHTDAFFWLMIAAGIGYLGSFLGYGMTAARYFMVQLPLFIIVTGLTALACCWLIPPYGLLGAAYALVISSLLTFVGSAGIMLHALHRMKDRHGRDASGTDPSCEVIE